MKLTVISLGFLTAFAVAQEWKPVAPTEKLLYDISFENDAPGGQPSGVKLEGKGLIAADDGSKVLQLSGPRAGITLPTVKLAPCQLGNQNPTLITFNLKFDDAGELIIGNQAKEAAITFARISKDGAVFDGADTQGAAAVQRGVLKAGEWHQVYINFDPSFKGYYISFTGADGRRVEYLRRFKQASYDFTLAISASAAGGKVSIDNIRGITGFALDKMPKQPHFPKGETYEPQPVVTTLTASPKSPDLTVRAGTLFETVKLTAHPVSRNGTLFLPASETFRALGASVEWDASTGVLTARKHELEVRLKAGSNTLIVNGASKNLSAAPVLVEGSLLVPIDLFNLIPDHKAAWSSTENRATIENGQIRRRLGTKTTNDAPSGEREIVVGEIPPSGPRNTLPLRYTFKNPGGKAGFAWTTLDFKETDDWKPVASYVALQKLMEEENRKEVWIRFQATTLPDNYNNTYFTSRHDGTINSFINGEGLRANVRGDGKHWVRFFNYFTRKDAVNKPAQYGLHYKAGGKPLLDVELVRGKSDKPVELRDAGTYQDGKGKVLSDKFKVVLDIAHIRDSQCIKGSDGYYYIVGTPCLHGSIPYARGINDGIELFRSKSRSGPFESMGYVWKFDTASWLNTRYFTVDQERNIWAPQIHEFDGKWHLIFFATKFPKNGLEGYSIFQIGIAVADNPLGPYKETTDKPLISAPDPHLFRDDDGSTYLTYGHGSIVKLKPGLDGLADTPRLMYPGNAPYLCNEGSTLFKANGKYYFGGAFSTYSFDQKGKMLGQTYDCVLAEADSVYGPYGNRYIAVKNAGNNSFLKDSDGKWYATVWQPGKITSLVKMELGPDRKWRPASNYTVVPPDVRY
ncbi:MAG: family 43 glycosylhydrolase [Verrucomicrobia bacterium]|nr:family 43 glycosylhydrolase [Verrucomicrobiota bacterium]